MRIKLSGLDQLQRTFERIKKTLAALDGAVGELSFDPHDPASIELAIQGMEQMVDERVGHHGLGPELVSLVENIKDKFREQILQEAAVARAQKNEDL